MEKNDRDHIFCRGDLLTTNCTYWTEITKHLCIIFLCHFKKILQYLIYRYLKHTIQFRALACEKDHLKYTQFSTALWCFETEVTGNSNIKK